MGVPLRHAEPARAPLADGRTADARDAPSLLGRVRAFFAPVRPSPLEGSPASARQAPSKGRHSGLEESRVRFGIVTRIALVNFAGLIFFMFGVLYLNQFRTKLIDERSTALAGTSELIAGIIAEKALTTLPVPGVEREVIDIEEANNLLRRTVLPSGYRARIYDRNGGLIADSYWLSADGRVETRPLPAPGDHKDFVEFVRGLVDALLPRETLPAYHEVGSMELGTVYEEVRDALAGEEGETLKALRRNGAGELVLSAAAPIQRFKALLGVLLISTEGADIDALVAEEERSIIGLFLTALAMTAILALGVAYWVAGPLKALAAATRRIHASRGRLREGLGTTLPRLAARWDEIGVLAQGLDEMTSALERRIDEIERFAADVAHELKNPLTSMRSALETLADTRDEDARARLSAIVLDDIRRLNRLITDISDASRLDAELSRALAEPVNVPRLIENLALVFAETHRDGNVTVRARVDTGSLDPGEVLTRGVELRLAQVFQNLLANAVSFSPAGGTVTLKVGLTGERARRMLRVEVEDEGPGIPEESLERIFERFYTERPESQDFGRNSGLGLSISRQIVNAHGGRIWAENRTDTDGRVLGARLVVELPLSAGEAP